LAAHLQISQSHIRHLYQQLYLPLLACHHRQQQERLAQTAAQHGGLILALDGLAPEGGEPQLWCIRELLTGVVLRSGWLARQDQTTFEGLLHPLRELALPIRAVVSDKQRGLVPAIATLFPDTPHQFCQSHFLRNLAEPLAAVDSALNVTLRKAVRQELGSLLLPDRPSDPAQPGVLTMTGLLSEGSPASTLTPAPVCEQQLGAAPAPAAPAEGVPSVECSSVADRATPIPVSIGTPYSVPSVECSSVADRLVTQLLRRIRYLLTLKGRPPLRLAGLETVAGLEQVAQLSATLLAHRHDERLVSLVHGIEQALGEVAPLLPDLRQGAAWVRQITSVLDRAAEQALSGEQVAQQLQEYLEQIAQHQGSPLLRGFGQHLHKVSRSYWSGLFHCYDHADIPRTNNGMESHFRDTQSRLLRSTGQKGRTRRCLHRFGAWELLPGPSSEAAGVGAFRQITPQALALEQQRMRDHQERFRLHTRSPRQTTAQLERLQQQWLALPQTSTG
jgi:hypothetical protein